MRWLAAGAMALLAGGCTTQRPGDRPQIRLGTDPCARCGMIVSEERFSAGYVDPSGTTVAFDDLGEFLNAVADHPDLIPVSFVHDAEQSGWLKAGTATYVMIKGLPTPMGSGIAAFTSAARASAFAGRLNTRPVPVRIGESVPVQVPVASTAAPAGAVAAL